MKESQSVPPVHPPIKEATALGWTPKPLEGLQTYPCRAGCGRSYTAQEKDKVGVYLRMHSYTCLDCRTSIQRFMAAQRSKEAKKRRNGTAERL